MPQYSLKQVFRYKFDNFMARGGLSIFISLVVAFLVLLITVGAIRGVVYAIDGGITAERHEGGFFNQLYQTFIHLSDPGTMAYDIDSSPGYKLTAILAGLGGVVIFSALIAFITTALDQKIHQLRKGHSKVIEENHTLILGWNERVVEILRELAIANESEDDACVVILSKNDKEFMDDQLKMHFSDTKPMRIVTRSGSESSLLNLDVVSVQTAKSVIALGSCNASSSDRIKADSDTIVVKTILAVVASLPDDFDTPIVAEVFHERNRNIVQDISKYTICIDANEILAKIMVQTSRSIGLSVVYSEIFSFDGCEMYFHNADWGGITFGDLPYRFPDGIPMGVMQATGKLLINPPPDTVLEAGDSILILAEDDSTIAFRSKPVAPHQDISLVDVRQEQAIEHELIIGWTPRVEAIVREYSDYVLDGSSIDIMLRSADENVREKVERIDKDLEGVSVTLIDANPLSVEDLLRAEPYKYDNIIILSQGDKENDDERTDSETIVILLMLRNIFNTLPEKSKNMKLITEVLDSENQALVARTGVHDFIISNRYISMLLAQISEDADIKQVYDDLFKEEGSEIYLKPTTMYFEAFPIEVTYADMIAIVQQRGEVCLGVKTKALEQDMNCNFGIKLIPEKNVKYTLSAEDSLVVLAEDET